MEHAGILVDLVLHSSSGYAKHAVTLLLSNLD